MITYTATNTYAKKGTHYIQAWVNNTLKFWTAKTDIYFGKICSGLYFDFFFKLWLSVLAPANNNTVVLLIQILYY